MTDWRKHANLFVPPIGNFKFLYNGQKYSITGIRHGFQFLGSGNDSSLMNIDLAFCTLIARRIEDMTDEEVLTFAKLYWDFEGYEIVSAKIENGICFIKQDKSGTRDNASFDLNDMRMPQSIYLLSIEVFPFSWPDEGVIDRKTIE